MMIPVFGRDRLGAFGDILGTIAALNCNVVSSTFLVHERYFDGLICVTGSDDSLRQLRQVAADEPFVSDLGIVQVLYDRTESRSAPDMYDIHMTAPNRPGQLASLCELTANSGLNILYAYGYVTRGLANAASLCAAYLLVDRKSPLADFGQFHREARKLEACQGMAIVGPQPHFERLDRDRAVWPTARLPIV